MVDAATIREVTRQLISAATPRGELEASLSIALYADAILLLMGEKEGVFGTDLMSQTYREVFRRVNRLHAMGAFDKAIAAWREVAEKKVGNYIGPDATNPLYYWLLYNIQRGSRELFVRGAAWAGKTYAIMQALLTLGLSSKLNISVLTPSLIHAKRGAANDLFELLLKYFVPYEEDRKNNIITLNNGTQFHFIGISSKNQQRGVKKDILFVNEANYVDAKNYSEHLIRTSMCAICDYNPFGVPMWIREKEQEAQRVGSPVGVIKVSARENRFLSPKILSDLESLKEPLRTIFLEGEYPNKSLIVKDIIYKGPQQKFFLPEEIVERIKYTQGGNFSVGVDWGDKAHTAVVLVVIDKKSYVLYAYELLYKTAAIYKDVYDAVYDVWRVVPFKVPVPIIADTNDTEGVRYLSEKGFRVGKKSQVPVDNQFMALFQYSFVIWGENLWKQIQALQMQLEGFNRPTEDHALDAFRYAAYYLVSMADPYYFTIVTRKKEQGVYGDD